MDSLTFNVLSLCSGVGGLDLGIRLAVPIARTVCFVEREGYCCEVLVKRMEEGRLDEAPIWTDLRTFDGDPWRGVVDCVIGGYPCQPFSKTGRLLAERDPRHLWPEVARIVREVNPQWCFFENVANHLHLGFEQVEHDLRSLGFRVASGVFTAEEVGSPHERERLYIVAVSYSGAAGGGRDQTKGKRRFGSEGGRSAVVPERYSPECRVTPTGSSLACFPPRPDEISAWHDILLNRPDLSPAIEPPFRGMVDGVANWVDRLRACGNGVVPEAAAYAWKTLVGSLIQ